jgi:hypothetical protein
MPYMQLIIADTVIIQFDYFFKIINYCGDCPCSLRPASVCYRPGTKISVLHSDKHMEKIII